jgi:hypothetical protein
MNSKTNCGLKILAVLLFMATIIIIIAFKSNNI